MAGATKEVKMRIPLLEIVTEHSFGQGSDTISVFADTVQVSRNGSLATIPGFTHPQALVDFVDSTDFVRIQRLHQADGSLYTITTSK